MKPTLNQADIKLLKSIFSTKDDLISMEKRQDQKYASKQDVENQLTGLESRLRKFINKEIDSLYVFLNEYVENIRLEKRLDSFEERITSLKQKASFA